VSVLFRKILNVSQDTNYSRGETHEQVGDSSRRQTVGPRSPESTSRSIGIPKKRISLQLFLKVGSVRHSAPSRDIGTRPHATDGTRVPEKASAQHTPAATRTTRRVFPVGGIRVSDIGGMSKILDLSRPVFTEPQIRRCRGVVSHSKRDK